MAAFLVVTISFLKLVLFLFLLGKVGLESGFLVKLLFIGFCLFLNQLLIGEVVDTDGTFDFGYGLPCFFSCTCRSLLKNLIDKRNVCFIVLPLLTEGGQGIVQNFG